MGTSFAPLEIRRRLGRGNWSTHLFGRLDGRPALPDFTAGSGSI